MNSDANPTPFDSLARDWSDISSEAWREYVFPCGHVVRIDGPLALHVSDSGGHRLWDGRLSHYVPARWVHLRWESRTGQPKFVA